MKWFRSTMTRTNRFPIPPTPLLTTFHSWRPWSGQLGPTSASATGLCRGPVVVNLSTSRLIDRIADAAGLLVHRTPVGQAYVAETALRVGADFAGEGSGQVILPTLHPGPDAIAATVLILDWLASCGRTIDDVATRLPRFHMIKDQPADARQNSVLVVAALSPLGRK